MAGNIYAGRQYFGDLNGAPAPAVSNKVILMGDSLLAATNSTTSAGGSTIDPAHNSQVGFINWFQAKAGFPWQITAFNRGGISSDYTWGGQSKGISGNDIFDTLGRLRAQLVNQNPDMVFLNTMTNDITAGRTYDNIMADKKLEVEQCLQAGAVVFVTTCFPRNNSGGNDFTSGQETIRGLCNAELRKFPQYYNGRVVVVDCDAVLTDTATGKLYTTYSYDGIHLNSTGAMAVGQGPLLAAWQRFTHTTKLPRYIPEDYNASTVPFGNLLTNSAFSGTSGTVNTGFSGSLATSWTATRTDGSSVTTTLSLASRTTWDGGTATFVEMLAAATGAGAQDETHRISPSSSVTTGVAIGTLYVVEVECHVEATASGTNPLRSVYAELRDNGTNGPISRMFNVGFSSGGVDDYFPDGVHTLLLRSQPIRANTTTGLVLRLSYDIDGQRTGTRKVCWGEPVLRIIPMVEEERAPIRMQKYNLKGANFVAHLPPGAMLMGIVYENTTANAVTGGVRVGTAAAGTQVVTAQAIGANAVGAVAAADLTTRYWSRTAVTSLYVEAVTSWNSATVNFTILYAET